MSEMKDTFSYSLVRTYDGGEPDEPLPPVGCALDFDDFQVSFHPEDRRIIISLTGYQIMLLRQWGWPANGRG